MTAPFFLPFMNGALDGMLNIAEELGDERVNQRPNDMANTSTPFIILTHCVGLTRYWLGSVVLGRPVTRDRDAEFRAQGTVADLRQAVQALQSELQDDINRVQFDQPSPNPDVVRQAHMKTWKQGQFLLQCYKELAQHHGQMELTRDVMLGRGPGN
jgi:Protein of unknown function (DUF664)